jgi:hypothetical protein
VRPLAPHDDGEVAPRNVILHVEPAKLPRDRRVLLRDVRSPPRLDDNVGRPVTRGERHRGRTGVPFGEAAKRLVGRASEREDVLFEVAGDHEGVRPELGQQLLRGEGHVLVLVDEEVVEKPVAEARRGRGLCDETREVDLGGLVEHREVLAKERRQLVPTAELGRRGPPLDVLGQDEGFLRARHELADLVGEPPQRQQRAVRRPSRRVFAFQQLSNASELLPGAQDRGRRRVAQLLESRADDVEGEPLHRDDDEVRKRHPEAREHRVTGQIARATGTDHERHPLGIRARLDQACEPLAQRDGLPGSGPARDEHRAGIVFEDAPLIGVGDVGGHRADATPGCRQAGPVHA